MEEWDGESFSGSKLQNVTFAENSKLETISRFTFARCSDLIKLDVPDSVTYIGPSAFADCTSLPSVTVPANTVIEPGTFNSYYKAPQMTVKEMYSSKKEVYTRFRTASSMTRIP